MDIKYLVEVAWDGDWWTAEHSNITDDVTDIETLRGRDYASQLIGKSGAGQLRATLRNEDSLYSPANDVGGLYGYIAPGRQVQVSCGLKKVRPAAHFVVADNRHLTCPDVGAADPFHWNLGNNALVWVNLHSLPTPGNTMGIIGKWQVGEQEWLLFVDNTAGVIRFKLSVRDAADAATTTVTAATFGLPAINTWYMLHTYYALTTEIAISVNAGAHDTAAHAAELHVSTAPFNIGEHSGGNYLDGLVGPEGTRNGSPWPHADLTWFYNAGAGHHYSESGIEGEEIIWWPDIWFSMEETTGTRINDSGEYELAEVGGAIGSDDGFNWRIYDALWSGAIDNLVPDLTEEHYPFVTLNGVGEIARLASAKTLLYPEAVLPDELPTGTWVGKIILAALGSTYSYVDEGLTTTGTFFAETEDALKLIREMEDTEMGFLSEPVSLLSGYWLVPSLTFRSDTPQTYMYDFADRHRRWLTARSLVPQAVFSDNPGVGELSYMSIKQEDPLKEIVNHVQARVQTTSPPGGLAVLWTLPATDLPALAPGEERWFTAQYPSAATVSVAEAFVDEWTTPVVGTDITQTGVANGDIAVTVFKKAKQMAIKVTNNHASAPATLTLVQARGTPVTYDDPVIATAKDDNSIDEYGLRTHTLSAKWLPNLATAQDYCNYVVSRYKDPNHIIELAFVANKSEAHLLAALKLNVSDRVTVVAKNNAGLGIDEDFYIESIHHSIDQGKTRHVTAYELSAVVGEGGYWVLGTSLLGLSTKLCY